MSVLVSGSQWVYLVRIADVLVGQRVTVGVAGVEHQAGKGTQRDDDEHSGSVHQQGAGERPEKPAGNTAEGGRGRGADTYTN